MTRPALPLSLEGNSAVVGNDSASGVGMDDDPHHHLNQIKSAKEREGRLVQLNLSFDAFSLPRNTLPFLVLIRRHITFGVAFLFALAAWCVSLVYAMTGWRPIECPHEERDGPRTRARPPRIVTGARSGVKGKAGAARGKVTVSALASSSSSVMITSSLVGTGTAAPLRYQHGSFESSSMYSTATSSSSSSSSSSPVSAPSSSAKPFPSSSSLDPPRSPTTTLRHSLIDPSLLYSPTGGEGIMPFSRSFLPWNLVRSRTRDNRKRNLASLTKRGAGKRSINSASSAPDRMNHHNLEDVVELSTEEEAEAEAEYQETEGTPTMSSHHPQVADLEGLEGGEEGDDLDGLQMETLLHDGGSDEEDSSSLSSQQSEPRPPPQAGKTSRCSKKNAGKMQDWNARLVVNTTIGTGESGVVAVDPRFERSQSWESTPLELYSHPKKDMETTTISKKKKKKVSLTLPQLLKPARRHSLDLSNLPASSTPPPPHRSNRLSEDSFFSPSWPIAAAAVADASSPSTLSSPSSPSPSPSPSVKSISPCANRKLARLAVTNTFCPSLRRSLSTGSTSIRSAGSSSLSSSSSVPVSSPLTTLSSSPNSPLSLAGQAKQPSMEPVSPDSQPIPSTMPSCSSKLSNNRGRQMLRSMSASACSSSSSSSSSPSPSTISVTSVYPLSTVASVSSVSSVSSSPSSSPTTTLSSNQSRLDESGLSGLDLADFKLRIVI